MSELHRLTAGQIVPMLRSITKSGERLTEQDFADIQRALDAARAQDETGLREAIVNLGGRSEESVGRIVYVRLVDVLALIDHYSPTPTPADPE
jgi:hypothetical protein